MYMDMYGFRPDQESHRLCDALLARVEEPNRRGASPWERGRRPLRRWRRRREGVAQLLCISHYGKVLHTPYCFTLERLVRCTCRYLLLSSFMQFLQTQTAEGGAATAAERVKTR